MTTTISRIEDLNGSIAQKVPCRVATAGNITLAGLQTIDGVVLQANDRVLVRLQTNQAENGIYVASTGNWQRAKDFNGAKDICSGTEVRVASGATLSGLWYIVSSDPLVIGSSSILFARDILSIDDSDDVPEGATNLYMTTSERSKLAGIAAGAEVNVNADWNAGSGDAQILNKPTLGTIAAQDANAVTITGGTVSQLSHIGINTTADATNVISASGEAILLSNGSGNAQVKVSKDITASTCSHLFQTNFSSRAEFGLIGNDDFAMKVSSDGTNFTTSFTLDNATGDVDVAQALTVNGNFTFDSVTYTGTTGADTSLVSGTAGTNGNLAMWNADGDAVDSTIAAANVARVNVAQEYTAQQNIDEVSLTDGANIAWNLNTAQCATVTLGGNRTLNNPTNMKAGGTYILRVVQDGTGSRTLSYGTAYKWVGGNAPTLSAAANAVDVLTFYSDGSNMLGIASLGFA